MPSDVAADDQDPNRRDFLHVASTAWFGVGAVFAAWPFLHQMNPSKDVQALASIEVDVSGIAEGQSIKVNWRGKPVFIRNRTAAELEEARGVEVDRLPDPQTDDERVKPGHESLLVLVGVCTHLGCIPQGESGDFGGWYCPCHGSHYDISGRIRKGPAPRNLDVPPYEFVDGTKILIG